MKSIEAIIATVDAMTDKEFRTICKAEDDYWELDSRVSRNGRKRMAYHLRKHNLTVDEWFAWCNL